jgi:hypothetical protein
LLLLCPQWARCSQYSCFAFAKLRPNEPLNQCVGGDIGLIARQLRNLVARGARETNKPGLGSRPSKKSSARLR